MKRFLKKSLTVALSLCLVLSLGKAMADEEECSLERVRELRHDISLLNLINGLHLSRGQIGTLLPKIKEAKKIKEEYKSKFESYATRAEESFTELKGELLQRQNPSPPVGKKVGRISHQQKEIQKEFMSHLIKLEEEVKGILNENQLVLIEEFSPCLLPPKNTANPVRIGQSGDTSHLETLLSRLRQMDEKRYGKRKEHIVSRMLDRYEEKESILTEAEKEKLKAKYLKVLEEARSLSDVDFEIKKGELAAKLQPSSHSKKARRKYQLSKVGRFLLDERLIPILEEKI